MSTDDYTTCLRSEVNQTEEAVEFILHILQLGGEDLLKQISDWWSSLDPKYTALLAVIAAGFGKTDAAKKLLGAVFSVEAAAAIVAFIVGFGVGVLATVLAGAMQCLPRLAQ